MLLPQGVRLGLELGIWLFLCIALVIGLWLWYRARR